MAGTTLRTSSSAGYAGLGPKTTSETALPRKDTGLES